MDNVIIWSFWICFGTWALNAMFGDRTYGRVVCEGELPEGLQIFISMIGFVSGVTCIITLIVF